MSLTTEIAGRFHELPADDLVHLVNLLAGTLANRYEHAPHGEKGSRPGSRYPLYDSAEAAARTFEQAAAYLRMPRGERLGKA